MHVNSEFAELSTRGSDHDPLVLTLSFSTEVTADLNGDGQINRRDYLRFIRTLGSSEGDRRYLPEADFNGDGRINRTDLKLFLALYREALENEIAGDIDRDGDRDVGDRRLLLRSLWSRAGSWRYRPEADLNHDDRISLTDFYLFKKL
ncbi:MAG: hypothetical protein KTR32_36835 [Granulosicoccus sp.]|nr:hypothetical protein [Granulosicoccus sp.]